MLIGAQTPPPTEQLVPIVTAVTAWQDSAYLPLRTALDAWVGRYRVDGYEPSTRMRFVDMRVDPTLRTLQVVANEAFLAQPLTPALLVQLRRQIAQQLPAPYNAYTLTLTDASGRVAETYLPAYLHSTQAADRQWGQLSYKGYPWVSPLSQPYKAGNLAGRHIAVWSSHGLYFKETSGTWQWQRPLLYTTTEDLFTQSIVLPFFVPMMERAGAVVYTPRERDWQRHEVIVDNDEPDKNYSRYIESLRPQATAGFETYGIGFAHRQKHYTDADNPFTAGTVRRIATTTRKVREATASYEPQLPVAGAYAVYVSYATLPNSIDDATYTIYHGGEVTRLRVNQRMGGGTWVYLGTYHFDTGNTRENRVVVSNLSQRNGVLTTDAVRFGGGVGNVVRSVDLLPIDSLPLRPQPTGIPSGLPRFAEGARYSGLWYGWPKHLFAEFATRRQQQSDYSDDMNMRSAVTNALAGGSPFVPDTTGYGKRVPIELTLAVHSDAGYTLSDALKGSLAISTTIDGEGSEYFRSGKSRRSSADYASTMLTTLQRELSAAIGRPWTLRERWDRNYSETRLPQVPSIILESLSHQNFADMRYGLDPNFKFAMGRAMYKATSHYLHYLRGKERPTMQPLPVQRFAATLSADAQHVTLSWQPQRDTLEDDGALPTSYVVYQRTGLAGDFDNGTEVHATHHTIALQPNKLYSFKVCAVNAGGRSFDSEVLCAYRAPETAAPRVLLINGFDRLSSPEVVDRIGADGQQERGFDLRADFGVAYQRTAEFNGYQTNFSPTAVEENTNDMLAGQVFAGNTFDHIAEHGRSLAVIGRYSFASASRAAVEQGQVQLADYAAIDLLLGLQRYTDYGIRRYKTFTPQLQTYLRTYRQRGGHLLVSGAYIGRDMQTAAERQFTQEILGYNYAASYTHEGGLVAGLQATMGLYNRPNEIHYAVQHSDVLQPTADAFATFAYPNGSVAGVAIRPTDSRGGVFTLGFPIEVVQQEWYRRTILHSALHFLLGR